MIGHVSLVTAPDPWIAFGSQVLSVIIGGIIALVANYFLQKHSFNLQNKTNLMNQRISAYNSLLGHISNYESSLKTPDMGLYLIRAASYGSPEIKALIKPIIEDKDGEFDSSKMKRVLIEEIMKEND